MKKIKNLYNKIFVVFSLCFAFVCGLFLIDHNTYAYTTDSYSDTLTYVSSGIYGAQYYSIYTMNEPITDYGSNVMFLVNFNTSFSTNSSYSFQVDLLDNNNNIIYDSFFDFSYSIHPINNKFSIVNRGTNNSTRYTISRIRFRYVENLGIDSISNIDLVSKDDITTLSYIDSYVEQYQEQLEELQQEYDDLQEQYDTLSDDLENLQQEYDDALLEYQTLQNQYNELFEQYNSLNQNIQYGLFSRLDYAEIDVYNGSWLPIYKPGTSDSQYFLQDLIDNNFLSIGGNFDFTSNITTWNPGYYSPKFSFYFNDLPVNYLDMIFGTPTICSMKIYNSDESQIFTRGFNSGSSDWVSEDSHFTFSEIVNNPYGAYDNFGDYVSKIILEFNNADSCSMLYTLNNNLYDLGWFNGYDRGYYVANSLAQTTINVLRGRVQALLVQLNEINIEDYDSQIHELEELLEIANLQKQAKYDEGYQDGLNARNGDPGTLYSMVIRNC